jgi:hypothetical protein
MLLDETSTSGKGGGVSQEFVGAVQGDVAGRDVVHHHHGNGRPLTAKERSELNAKVTRLHEEFRTPGWKTWRSLHGYAGVENIDAMRLGHRDSVNAILDLMLEVAGLEKRLQEASSIAAMEKAASQPEEVARLLLENGRLSARVDAAEQKQRELEKLLSLSEGKLASAINALRETRRAGEALGQELSNSTRRTKRSAALAVLVIIGAGGAAYAAFDQAKRAAIAESRLLTCEFGGEAYAVGSVVAENASRECVLGEEGIAVWQAQSPAKRVKPR